MTPCKTLVDTGSLKIKKDSMMISIIETGVLYRNPKPHVRSIHAYFPSVAVLPDGEMVATYALGEAFECADLHTHISRSRDNGRTWTYQGKLDAEVPGRLTSQCSRLTALKDGSMAVLMIRLDRSKHPEEGMTNPKTLGFVPTELLIARSSDGGRTWVGPKPFTPPLEGPAFELCCPITPLSDGRWLIPTQTWPDWEGRCPNGIKMIAMVSHDQGETWPEYLNVMTPQSEMTFCWESKIVEFPDGRLLAVAWLYDDVNKTDLPNHYALSRDGGKIWSKPVSTGILGQTLSPLVIDNNRVLCVYRRMDKPGLWANLARLDGDTWINEEEKPLWGHQANNLTATTENMSHNFNVLRFGAPCMCKLSTGEIFMAFWCYEDCVSVIRWITLRVE